MTGDKKVMRKGRSCLTGAAFDVERDIKTKGLS